MTGVEFGVLIAIGLLGGRFTRVLLLLFLLALLVMNASGQTLTNADLGKKFNRPPASLDVYVTLQARAFRLPHEYPMRMPELPSTDAQTPWEWPKPSNVVRLDGSSVFQPPFIYGGWYRSPFPVTGIYAGPAPHSGSEGSTHARNKNYR